MTSSFLSIVEWKPKITKKRGLAGSRTQVTGRYDFDIIKIRCDHHYTTNFQKVRTISTSKRHRHYSHQRCQWQGAQKCLEYNIFIISRCSAIPALRMGNRAARASGVCTSN
jgi:hypothetical protein